MLIPKKIKDFYTVQTTDNFMHAVRIVKMNKPTIAGMVMKTDKDICNILNVHPPTISHIAKGKRSVTLEMAADMCKLFGFSIEWMMFNHGNPRGDMEMSQRINDIEVKVMELEKIVSVVLSKSKK
jgi:plasmid maintenance system antidote protein VapI